MFRVLSVLSSLFVFVVLAACSMSSVSHEGFPDSSGGGYIAPSKVMTVTGLSWDYTIKIYSRSDVITESVSVWSDEVPLGVEVISRTMRIDHSAQPPKWRETVTFLQAIQPDHYVSRMLHSEGIGHQPEPYWEEYELEGDEYLPEHHSQYHIQFTDQEGKVWTYLPHRQMSAYGDSWHCLTPPLYDVSGYELYLNLEIGDQVSAKTHYGPCEGEHVLEWSLLK